MRRQYSGGAQPAKLTADLGASTTNVTIYCDDLTNWPNGSIGPFYVVIDRGKNNEEKILCSSRSGNILTVFDNGLTNGRAADGTSITAHSSNADIEHIFTATDANEANLHVNTPPLHITICTSSTRPASPTANQTILETDTRSLYCYIGGVWEPVSSSSTTGSVDVMLLMGG
jgi:hypothetical protein